MNGRTEFFNYGFANLARNERVTADSLFNLGSVGKLFATTLLAEAVKRGELSLDDSVATGIGRQILHALAQDQSLPSMEGEPEPDRD